MKKRTFFLSRKGAAIEMAIMLVMVTFALSTLVLSTALLQHVKEEKAELRMTQGIVLEQIGERFCTATAQGDTAHEWVAQYPDYTITVTNLTLTAADAESGEVLLTVELAPSAGGYTVTRWNKK